MGDLETELYEVGRELHRAMPATRNPLKAFDDKAMDLASQDQELKAALFRFVDVVPACRNLDDLANHLIGFLGEVEDQPTPVSMAVKMGGSKMGRRMLGIAAASGVRHMAHRFIVGETPRDACRCWRSEAAVPIPARVATSSTVRSVASRRCWACRTRCWVTHAPGD